MLWPLATTNSGGLAAAKLITKLGKISRNGNIDNHRILLSIQSPVSDDGSDPLLGRLRFRRAIWSTVVVRKLELPTLRYGSKYYENKVY